MHVLALTGSVVLLGGRVSEEEVVGEMSTGAQDDLASAAALARRMVCELGTSEAASAAGQELARLFVDEQARARCSA